MIFFSINKLLNDVYCMLFQVHFNVKVWTESKTENGKCMLKKDAILTDKLVLQNTERYI